MAEADLRHGCRAARRISERESMQAGFVLAGARTSPQMAQLRPGTAEEPLGRHMNEQAPFEA